MKYFVKGVGEVNLAQNNFVANGGEGSIYTKSGIAYKIYENASKMIPVAKIKELSVLDHPSIIKPERLILEGKKNTPVGYTMKFVKNTHALCQLFTKAFRQRNSIDDLTVVELIKKLEEIIQSIHNKNILVVDLNELNFLVNKKFDDIYAIDVNGYQTPSFPANAIMESIRDRHSKKFNAGTDWFSFGVVTFQMLIGIHPFKGKYPQYDSVPIGDRMDKRMRENISVFHKGVSMPAACQPFNVIPKALKDWYIAVFEKGERVPPPRDYQFVAIVVPKVKSIIGNNNFEINKIADFPDTIVNFYSLDGHRVVVTDKAVFIDNKIHSLPNPNIKIGFTPKMGKPIAAYIDNGLKLYDLLAEKEIPLSSGADNIMEVDGRLYVHNNVNVLEVTFMEMGDNLHVALKAVGKVLDLPEATHVFDGVIMQNLLGRWYASVFPMSAKCYQISIKELDNYKIVDAKYENGVLVIEGYKGGKYDRFVIRMSGDYSNYNLRKIEDIPYAGLNFTVSDSGICVMVNEQEDLEIFHNKTSSQVKVIDDPVVKSNMNLYHEGTKILFTRDKELYSIRMK